MLYLKTIDISDWSTSQRQKYVKRCQCPNLTNAQIDECIELLLWFGVTKNEILCGPLDYLNSCAALILRLENFQRDVCYDDYVLTQTHRKQLIKLVFSRFGKKLSMMYDKALDSIVCSDV
jgi:hypothetical protein